MNAWFGNAPWAEMCHDTPQIPTPVGCTCARCHEPFVKGDEGLSMSCIRKDGKIDMLYQHRACFLRGVIGSVMHQQGLCSCKNPDSTEHDPPGLTIRQAAEAAVSLFERRKHPL